MQQHSKAFAVTILGWTATFGVVPIAMAGQSPLAALPQPVPPILQSAQLVGHMPSSQVINVSVGLTVPSETALTSFVNDISNPKSPNYRKFLTPTQVGTQFGLLSAQVQTVVNYLTSQGLTVKLVSQNRMSILASGTVSQLESAFHTTINQYHNADTSQYGNPNFHSYAKVLQVPSNIASLVTSVGGVQNFIKPKPATTLTPSMSRTLYNLAPIFNAGYTGSGRTVGISSWDGYLLSNVPLFYATFGLPSPPGGVGSNITQITSNGGAGSPGGEADLDIQMTLAQAPLCNLRIYNDGAGDLLTVLTEEADDDLCDVITESYGWAIYDTPTLETVHNLHLSMSAEGITYMNASGDYGTPEIATYPYPDMEPESLVVGGTEATTDGLGNRVSEVAWGPGGGQEGGVGGWSTIAAPFNVLQSWQVGTGVPTNINFRICPDVAGHAWSADNEAYYLYFDGQETAEAGTSAASPTFAGQLATAEQRLISLGWPPNSTGTFRFGRIAPLFYSQNQRSDVWFDITSGTNGTLPNGTVSTAGLGWDFCTGWGAINWQGFVDSINLIPPVSVPATNAIVFDQEGGSTTGTAGASFTVTSINDSLGAVAAAQLTYKLTAATSKIASLQLQISFNAPSQVTNFLYVKNVTTGNYVLLNTTPTLGTTTTYKAVLNMTNYVNSAGQVILVDRAIRPARFGGTSYKLDITQSNLLEDF